VSSYRRRQFASKRGNIATKRRTGSDDRAVHLRVDVQVQRKHQRRARDRFVKNAVLGIHEEQVGHRTHAESEKYHGPKVYIEPLQSDPDRGC